MGQKNMNFGLITTLAIRCITTIIHRAKPGTKTRDHYGLPIAMATGNNAAHEFPSSLAFFMRKHE